MQYGRLHWTGESEGDENGKARIMHAYKRSISGILCMLQRCDGRKRERSFPRELLRQVRVPKRKSEKCVRGLTRGCVYIVQNVNMYTCVLFNNIIINSLRVCVRVDVSTTNRNIVLGKKNRQAIWKLMAPYFRGWTWDRP